MDNEPINMEQVVRGSSVIQAIQHGALFKAYMEDFVREKPDTLVAALFKTYIKKVDWIFLNFKSYPDLPDIVRDGVRDEIKGDLLGKQSIHSKVSLLPECYIDHVEKLLDMLLDGESMKVVKIEVNEKNP